jgi:hypothetical protein
LTILCDVIATGYGMDDRGVEVRFPVASRLFTSLHCQGRLWSQSNLLTKVYRVHFPKVKAARSWGWPPIYTLCRAQENAIRLHVVVYRGTTPFLKILILQPIPWSSAVSPLTLPVLEYSIKMFGCVVSPISIRNIYVHLFCEEYNVHFDMSISSYMNYSQKCVFFSSSLHCKTFIFKLEIL